jgi:ATP-dependent DNA helicase RecQ
MHATPASLRSLLRTYWGYEAFRPLQEEIIAAVVAGRDALALLPTGGGKSLCYQLPAIGQDGCCLVISPLIALMEDQVAQLLRRHIPAAALHAGIKGAALQHIVDNIKDGAYKLIYCSPERLQSRQFQALLPYLRLSLIAVDEAHCVSQWGHDFRPEYLQISWLKKRFPRLPILALTASATPEVVADIRRHLHIPDAATFRQSFARENIYYEVRYTENKPADLLHAVQEAAGSGIVYCRSRKQTEAVSHQLNTQGVKSVHYHAGMKQEARIAAQEAWIRGEIPVIAATTAFGMGIDKADVRLVVHYDAPEDLESWYQESGRCGRDGKKAHALTLYNQADIRRMQGSTRLQYPPAAYLREVYQAVAEYLQIPIGAQPDRYFPFEITDFCKKFSLKPTSVSPALRLLAQEGFWTLTESVFHPPTVQFVTDRRRVDELAKRYPVLGNVTTALLRLYTGIFQYPAPVHVVSIGKKLRWKQADVTKALAQLAALGIIEWEPVAEGPQLFFHSCRADSRDLIIDAARIDMLRSRHEARVSAMLQFLQDEKACRGNAVLEYFGEAAKNACGHCDVCRAAATNIPTGMALRSLVTARLQAAGIPVGLGELSSQLPAGAGAPLITVLRSMVDGGQIVWHPDNSFSLPPTPDKKRSKAARS